MAKSRNKERKERNDSIESKTIKSGNSAAKNREELQQRINRYKVNIDHSVFEKTPDEKWLLKQEKKAHKYSQTNNK